MTDYTEPQLTVAVLDFRKPNETRLCLESVKQRIKVPHRVVYYHNGPAEHAYQFYTEGLVDLFLQSRINNGLGVGTRDLLAAVSTPYFIYLQNDQVIARDLTQPELDALIGTLGSFLDDQRTQILSISLAGPVGGSGVYSERCHIMETAFYREMEQCHRLPVGGAGPWSHLQWREEAIQRYYNRQEFTHLTSWRPLVYDRGIWTVRDNPCGGRVRMRTDTKAVWWEVPPKEPYVFPEHSPAEWEIAIAGEWPAGRIPAIYQTRGESFNCWGDQPDPIS